MGSGARPCSISKRERLRSRFCIAPLAAGIALLLAACAGQFGAGIAELPASQGWQPLPIGSWVLNDGLEARSMVFCPRDACTKQGFAAVVAFSGPEARRIEQSLRADPASLARLFSKPPPNDAPRPKARPRGAPKSTTDVSRFEVDGVAGLLVEIRAKDTTGKSATTAILHGREEDRLIVALAVAETPDAARRDAIAAWRGR